MQVLSSAANFGANILLSMAVSGVVSFFDDLIHAEERAIEKGQQARQNIQSLGDAYRNQTGNAGEPLSTTGFPTAWRKAEKLGPARKSTRNSCRSAGSWRSCARSWCPDTTPPEMRS